MRIVDAQVHIWGANTPQRPWPARAAPQRAEPWTADEVLRAMHSAGVERVIIVPPSWEGDRNDLALAAAQAHPTRFAVMGRLDPDAPGAREQIKTWREQPGMLGLRFSFHTPILRQPFLDGRFDWVWGAAEDAGLPVMVLLHHAWLARLVPFLAAHPRLRVVIDHLGLVNGEKDAHAFRDVSKRGGQGERVALLQRRGVSVCGTAAICAPRGRRLRSAPGVLGYRLVAAALHLPTRHRDVHRAYGVAVRRRPGVDHGTWRLRMARLEVDRKTSRR
jgi:hypothetical protein